MRALGFSCSPRVSSVRLLVSSKSPPRSCSPSSTYLLGGPTYLGLILIILLIYLFYLLILLTSGNDIKAHVLSQLPKCLQLARAHPFHPEPICSPTAVPKFSLSICPLFYMSLWFAHPYIGMMFSRLLSHDCHVCGALQAGSGPKDSQSPHGRRQISKKAFITWGAGVVRAVMGGSIRQGDDSRGEAPD